LESENTTPFSTYHAKVDAQKALVEELKVEWKSMWCGRFNDKVIAEGISVDNYEQLRIARGTVIQATKDFKAPNFKDILKEHLIENPDRYVQPRPEEGGWAKFVKTKIAAGSSKPAKRADAYVGAKNKSTQPKKGGRGWLHTI
jgi:hypothetical protein